MKKSLVFALMVVSLLLVFPLVKADSLIHNWKFDESANYNGQRGEVKDSSGIVNGRASGNLGHASGRMGLAADFTGNNYIMMEETNSLSQNKFTISGWFYNRNFDKHASWISKRNSYIFEADNTGKVRFYLYKNGWIATAPASGSPEPTASLNTWEHWAATYDGSSLKVYKNGVEVSSASTSGSPGNSGDLYIGYDYNSGDAVERYFNGMADDIRIYDRALAVSEIKILTNTKTCLPNQAIFKMYGEKNSHIYPATSNAPYEICYGDLFKSANGVPINYAGANPYACTATNAIFRVSSADGNAHVEDPKANSPVYSPQICYGDLSCVFYENGRTCNSGGKVAATVSGLSNAHISVPGDVSYEYELCCANAGVLLVSQYTPILRWYAVDSQGATTLIQSSPEGTTPGPFYFTPGTTKVRMVLEGGGNYKGAKVEFRLDEEDTKVPMDVIDDGIKNDFQQMWIDQNGQAYAEWNMPSTDIAKAFGGIGQEEDAADDAFEFIGYAQITGGPNVISEILNAQSRFGRWVCDSSKTTASRTGLDGEPEIVTTFFLDKREASDAEKQLAGQTCGKSNFQNGETCCPNTAYCTNVGCATKDKVGCEEYKTEPECTGDIQEVWKNILQNDPVVRFSPINKCENIVTQVKCVWDSGSCKRKAVEVDKKTNMELGSCVYSYVEVGNAGCVNGEKRVTKQSTLQSGTLSCIKGCDPDPQELTIPCGSPVFQLPFAGFWQIVGAVIVIGILYLFIYKKKRKK